MGYQALLFCPDEKAARGVTQVLNELDFTVEPCTEPFAAVKKLMAQHFDAIVVDCDNEQNATLLFKSARNSSSNQSSLAVAVVEGQAGVAKAFRIGANLVLTKPINIEQAKARCAWHAASSAKVAKRPSRLRTRPGPPPARLQARSQPPPHARSRRSRPKLLDSETGSRSQQAGGAGSHTATSRARSTDHAHSGCLESFLCSCIEISLAGCAGCRVAKEIPVAGQQVRGRAHGFRIEESRGSGRHRHYPRTAPSSSTRGGSSLCGRSHHPEFLPAAAPAPAQEKISAPAPEQKEIVHAEPAPSKQIVAAPEPKSLMKMKIDPPSFSMGAPAVDEEETRKQQEGADHRCCGRHSRLARRLLGLEEHE